MLIKATPRAPELYLLRAEVHFQSGAPDRAAHDMEKSFTLGGRPPADLKERLYRSWYSPRLKELKQRGEVVEARALEKKIMRLGVAPGHK